MNKLFAVFALLGLLLASCSAPASNAASTAEPTPLPVVSSDSTIVAQGSLVPSRSVEISFDASGQVTEVLVKEGDLVKAGDILARLGNREKLEASIANAELELFLVNQTLANLDDNLPGEQTAVLEELTNAKDALRDAERKAGSLSNPEPASDNDIEIARANVAIAKKALNKAKDDYKPWEKKPEDNLTRAGFLQKLDVAQKRYDDTVKKLNKLLGITSVDFAVQQSQAQLAIAQARLEQAQEKYDILMAGPDPKEVDEANARISNAKASLAAAEAALSDLELVAPIDGTVVKVNLIAGQQVSQGQAAMDLADFSIWYVETDNLTDVDVVNVANGQVVSLVPDAISDLELTGKVDSISHTYEEKRGDITYTVRIRLDKIDPRMRWGMTIVATFEKK